MWVWDPGYGIRDPRSGKNLFRIPDPGVKKAPDPGSGSATLPITMHVRLRVLTWAEQRAPPDWTASRPQWERAPECSPPGTLRCEQRWRSRRDPRARETWDRASPVWPENGRQSRPGPGPWQERRTGLPEREENFNFKSCLFLTSSSLRQILEYEQRHTKCWSDNLERYKQPLQFSLWYSLAHNLTKSFT